MPFKSISNYSLAIVFLGNFNPSIVNPSWLARKKLIRESEADNADLSVNHPEITKFSLSFVEIQVTMNKFQLISENEAEFDLIRDLAVSIFSILSETPVAAIGINHFMHFQMISGEEYYNFGNWLCPLSNWKDSLIEPKMLELKIMDTPNQADDPKNHVTVSPSDKLTTNGVRVQLNYHINLKKSKISSVGQTLLQHWSESFTKAQLVITNLNSKFK